MADYLVINGTDAALSNINAGGSDVAAYGYGVDADGVDGAVATLTDTELGTLLANDGVAVVGVSTTQEQRRLISKILRLGKNPGSAAA